MWKSKSNSKSTTNFNSIVFIFTLIHLNPKNIFQFSSVTLLAEGKSIPKVLTDISVNLGSERHRSQDETQFCYTNTHIQANYQSLPSTATIVSESKRLARQHKGFFGSRLLCEVSLKVKLLKDERPYRTICLYRDYIDLSIFEKGAAVHVEKVSLRVEQIYKDLQPVKGFILNEPNSVVQGYLVKKQFYGSIRMYDKYRLYHIAFYIEPISTVQMYNHNPNFNFAQSNKPGGSHSGEENAVLFEYISTLEKSEWIPCVKIENQIQTPIRVISLNPERTTAANTNGTTLQSIITSTVETNASAAETYTSNSETTITPTFSKLSPSTPTVSTTETGASAEIESNSTLSTHVPVTPFLQTSDLNLTAPTTATAQKKFSVTSNRTTHITPAPTPFNILLSTEVTVPESSRRKPIEPIHSTTKETVVAVKLGTIVKSKSKPTKTTKKPVHPLRSKSSSNLPDALLHSTVITATTKKFYSTIKLGNKIPEAQSNSLQTQTKLGKPGGRSASVVLQQGDIKIKKVPPKKKRKCKTRKKEIKLSTEILSFRMSTEKWNPDDPEFLSRFLLFKNKTGSPLPRSNTKKFNENNSSTKLTVKNKDIATMSPTTDIIHSTIATRKVRVLKITKSVKANYTGTKKSLITIGAEGFEFSTEHPSVPVKHSTVQQNKGNFIRARHAKQITINRNNSLTVHVTSRPQNTTSHLLPEEDTTPQYLPESDSYPRMATTATATATAELEYCDEEKDELELVTFSSKPISSADKSPRSDEEARLPVSDLSFSTEVPSPKPIQTTRVTAKFRASTDLDEDDSMNNIRASKVDLFKTGNSGGGGLAIFIPSTDIMEVKGVASITSRINFARGGSLTTSLPTNIRTSNNGTKTDSKVSNNTTHTGVQVPTNANTTNTGIKVPTNTNATNTGIKLATNANATNTGIKLATNANATKTGIKLPTNANATNTGIKGPTNANVTNTGIQVPTNANATKTGIKGPPNTNATKAKTSVPINKKPATTKTKTTTTTTTTTTKTTTKLTTTTTFYPTNFVLSTEKSAPRTSKVAPYHSTDVTLTWPDGINPDESTPYHSSDPRVKSRKPTKPMHSTVRDTTTRTTKLILEHSTEFPGARRNHTLKKKKNRKTTFMPFMLHSTAPVSKRSQRQRTDGNKAIPSLKGRFPVHSSEPPGASTSTTVTFNKTLIIPKRNPVHSLEPPGASTTVTFNKSLIIPKRNPVHSSEPPGARTAGTFKRMPVHSSLPPGARGNTTLKKKKKKTTTTFLRHSTAVTALIQQRGGIMGKAMTERSLEPQPGQNNPNYDIRTTTRVDFNKHGKRINPDQDLNAALKPNLTIDQEEVEEYPDFRYLDEDIPDLILPPEILKMLKLSTENGSYIELEMETSPYLIVLAKTSPDLALLSEPETSPVPDLVLPLETDQYLIMLPETSPAPAPVSALVLIQEADPYLILIPETSPDLIVRQDTTRIKLKTTSTFPFIEMRKTKGIGRYFPVKKKKSSPPPSVPKPNVDYGHQEDFIAQSINNSFLKNLEKFKKLKISTDNPQDVVAVSLENDDDFPYSLENSPDLNYPKLLRPLSGRNVQALLPDHDAGQQSQESNRENAPSLDNHPVNNPALIPLLELVKRIKLSTKSNQDQDSEPELTISLENESDLKYVQESVPNIKLTLKTGRRVESAQENNPHLNVKGENDRYVKPSSYKNPDLPLPSATVTVNGPPSSAEHSRIHNNNHQLLRSDVDQLGQNLQEPKNNVFDSPIPIPSDNDISDQEVKQFISLEDNTENEDLIIQQRRRRNANAIDFNNFFGDDAAVNEEDVLEGLEFSDGKTESVVFDLRRDSALVCQLCIWIQPFFAEIFGLGGGISNGIAEVVDIIKFTDWIYRTIDFNHDGFQENIGFSIKKILLSDKINFDIGQSPNSVVKNGRRKRASNSNSKIKMYPQAAHRHNDYNYLKESPGDSLAQLMQKFKEINQDSAAESDNFDQNNFDFIDNKNQEEHRKKRFNFEIYVNEMYEKEPDVLYANGNGQQQMNVKLDKGTDKLNSKENIEDVLTGFSRDIKKFSPTIALKTLRIQLLDSFRDDHCCAILGFLFHDFTPDFSATTKRSVCSENNVGIISGYFGSQKISKFDVFRGVMHTLGHMFGASHSSISGSEFDDKKFTDFINPFPLHPLQQLNVGLRPNSFTYSSLAKDQMTMFLDSRSADCLKKKSVHSYCGDGILDDGEECDCGTPWQCEQTSSCCGERQSFVGCQIIIPGKKRCSRKSYGK